MKKTITYGLLLTALLVGTGLAGDGGGAVRLGYLYADEEGNLAVNQESYNLYEGFGLSLPDWRYQFDNGMNLTANLENLTLNNRNLRASIGKPGQFDIRASNNQYRRFYTFDGANFTRRNSTMFSGSVQPSRYLKAFGGYNVTNKKGNDFRLLSPATDTLIRSTDYKQTGYNLGAWFGDQYGWARLEYRAGTVDDQTTNDLDRDNSLFSISVSSMIPRFHKLLLAGGFSKRTDKFADPNATDAPTYLAAELKTTQAWGGAKMYVTKGVEAEYRFLFAIGEQVNPNRTTDHLRHSLSLGKNWGRVGGVRGGFEYRVADDYVDKTSTTGFTFHGWYRPNERFSFTALTALMAKKIDEGTTLLGEEDLVRHRVTGRYRDTTWGDISGVWQARSRTWDDISAETEYSSYTAELNLTRFSEYARFNAAYTYNQGTYENSSDQSEYEFADHILRGHLYFKEYRKLSLDAGATWYRSKKDQDLEKSTLEFGAIYKLCAVTRAEVRYRIFNFDDFLVRGSYYTGNIVDINLTRDINL